MSEEQIKPKLKWYKNWPTILFFLLLVCLIAFVIISTTRPRFRTDTPYAYEDTEAEFQNAVTAYQASNNGSLPTLNSMYTNANCINCSVINISALLIANDGLMKCAPTGLNLSASGNDNCGGDASLGCNNEGSYIWIVNTSGTWKDTYGTICSYCAGAKCKTNNSGYQGVWP